MEDIFAIQEEIAQAIVRTLHVQFAHGAGPALAARARSTVTSHEYYLKGRYHMHRRTPDELRRALQYFEAAAAADPQSAVARSGVADAYTLLADYLLVPPAEGIAKAKAAATAALELDPGLAEAYPSLAWIRSLYDWEWAEGEALYRKGIALNPGYATGHHWFGTDLLAMVGRLDEASWKSKRRSTSTRCRASSTTAAIWSRSSAASTTEAIRGCRRILEFDPTFYKAFTTMGRAYSCSATTTKRSRCWRRAARWPAT